MLLDGVRVLDLSRLLPGPYATVLMADLGAEVIKVEPPGQGDPARGYGLFEAVNRHKKSVVLDLATPEGRADCLRLAADVDVFFESFRPGVAASLGLGYEEVRAVNPRIVYTSMTGWGQTGPLSRLAGHDLNYLSMAGVIGITGSPAVGPVIPGVQIADLGGGMLAAFGTVSAVLHARATGEGTYLDVAMFDLAVSWQSAVASDYLSGGPAVGPGDGLLSGGIVCYNVYGTADGQWVSIGALEPKFWSRFCAAAGRPDLEQVAFAPARPGEAGYDAVAALFRERSRDEWTQLGLQADCCLTPVLTMAEAFASEQMKARGMLWSSTNGQTAYPAHPLVVGAGAGSRGRGPGAAPKLGADSAGMR